MFRPVGRCIADYYMAVYNRWGAKVFESYDRNEAWDGTINGEPAEVGTYAYHAQVHTWLNEHVESKGNVTLLR
jgi:gliding motility-associated-like protein